MDKEKSQKITLIFDIVLFIYIGFAFLAEYLFKPETSDKAPWEILFKNSPELSITLALIFAAVLILAGAQLLKIFWNRFISDIAKNRNITFQEAMAIFLIIGVIFS